MKTQSIGTSNTIVDVYYETKSNGPAHARGVATAAALGSLIVPAFMPKHALAVADAASGKTHTFNSMASWMGVSEALRNYIKNRKNGNDNKDIPDHRFPDGGIGELREAIPSIRLMDWPDTSKRFKWVLKLTLHSGEEVKIKQFYWKKNRALGWPDVDGRYWFDVYNGNTELCIRGFSARTGSPLQFDDTHSPEIRQWMEERDFNYLKRIYMEAPVLFAKEFAELKAVNLNHPAISKIETVIKAEKMLLPFYEDKMPTISIAKVPFCITTVASSSSFSSSVLLEVEKTMALSAELSCMGLSGTKRSAAALNTQLKQTRWQSKTEAHREILHWVIKLHPEICVSLFQIALKSPDNPDIQLIAFMMHASKSVVTFKFPFSLISILWREKDSRKEVLHQLIYLALKRIAKEQIVSDPESGCIAMFKLLLKSALKKGMITEMQFHQLDNIAEKTAIFSDERFLALKKEIGILKEQFSSLDVRMGTAEKNLQLVADSVNELKKAFQRQGQRRLFFSIATTGLSFLFAHGLVEAIAGIADLSDLAEVGSIVLNVPVEQSQSYLDDGLQALMQNKRIIAQQGSAMMLKGLGLNPDKFLETWVSANIVLQGSPQDKARLIGPAVSMSSSISSSSSSSSSHPKVYKPEVVTKPAVTMSSSSSISSSSSSSSSHPKAYKPEAVTKLSRVLGVNLSTLNVSTSSHSSQSLEPRPVSVPSGSKLPNVRRDSQSSGRNSSWADYLPSKGAVVGGLFLLSSVAFFYYKKVSEIGVADDQPMETNLRF